MKILTFYFLISIIISNNAYCQRREAPTLAIGISHRMASLRLNDKSSTGNIYGGPISVAPRSWYLSIDLKKNVFKKKIILELSNYLTYSELRRKQPNLSSPEMVTEYSKRHDHFLSLIYPIKNKKHNFSFLLGGGLGYMNLSTGFRFDRLEDFDSFSGPRIRKNVKGSLAFLAPKLIVGVEKNRFNGFVIVNGTPDADNDSNPTLWIEFKTTYTFRPFKKKKK
jgi:hypothetical protein